MVTMSKKTVAPRIGALIIGDEILSGKKEDQHFPRLREMLGKRGLRLAWVHYAPDNRAILTELLKRSLVSNDIVFSYGGIGNTPDDHTRQAAATALGVQLVFTDEAKKTLRLRFGDNISAQQKLLATFPSGCSLIPNPFNNIPGFMTGTHYFLPGFPQMAHPMTKWALDSFHAKLFLEPGAIIEKSILLYGPRAYESYLLGLMQHIVDSYPELRLFSLPGVTLQVDSRKRYLELGVEGQPPLVEAALVEIVENIEKQGIDWRWQGKQAVSKPT